MKRLFLGILAICWVIGVKAQEVFSPDGKINVRFFLSEKVSTGNQRMYPEGTPYYEVLYDEIRSSIRQAPLYLSRNEEDKEYPFREPDDKR